MDVAPYIPLIIEATKFLYGKIAKWIEHARQRSGKSIPAGNTDSATDKKTTTLTQQDFATLESNITSFMRSINLQVAETNAYVIKGLVEQIQTHHRNLVDLETSETEFGSLTPPHIKRGIEREAVAIIEKSARLQGLLEQVYGKTIEFS